MSATTLDYARYFNPITRGFSPELPIALYRFTYTKFVSCHYSIEVLEAQPRSATSGVGLTAQTYIQHAQSRDNEGLYEGKPLVLISPALIWLKQKMNYLLKIIRLITSRVTNF